MVRKESGSSCSLAYRSRISLQQKEFEKQVDSVKDIYERYQKYFSPEAKKIQEKVLKDITSRHAKLRLRMDEQLRLVMLSCQPGLSKEENEWIEKLQTLSDKINGTSGYASRIDLVNRNIMTAKERWRLIYSFVVEKTIRTSQESVKER